MYNSQKFFIEGVSNNDEIMYSKTFTHRDLIENRKMFITIPEKEENPYSPLEVENRTGDPIWVYVDDAIMGLISPGESLKRRPLPSAVSSYTIKVESNTYSKDSGSFPVFINRVFTRIELTQDNWKIVVENTETSSIK